MNSVALSLQNDSKLGIFKAESKDLSFEEKQISDLREVNQNLRIPLSEAVLSAAECFMPETEDGQVNFLVFKTGDPQCTFYQSWGISGMPMKDHTEGVKTKNHIRFFKTHLNGEEQVEKIRSLCWVPIDFSTCVGKSVAEVRSEFPDKILTSNEAIVASKYLNGVIPYNILIPGYQVKRPRAYNGNGWDLILSITFDKSNPRLHFGKRDETFKSSNYTVPIIGNSSEKIEVCF